MKIVFFGTPDYVVPILNTLSREHEIVAVVTQPPRSVGRKQFKQFSPVDDWAHKRRISKYFEAVKIIEERIDADLGVLAAYGEFIPQNVLSYFKYGILNIHPSLLPKWRGASPVQAALLSFETHTGITVIKLDSQMDHGPIVSQTKEEILENDNASTLRIRLFQKSAQFLVDLLPSFVENKIKLKAQDEAKATFSKLIKKEDGFIPPKYLDLALKGVASEEKWKIRFMNDFEVPVSAKSICRFIDAMQTWPGAWTQVINDKKPQRLKILKANVANQGEVSNLVLDSVQVEGKNPVSFEEFKRGYPNFRLKD